jgi:predicted ATPase
MLQITLGTSLVVTKGYAASDVARTYTRARELCQQVGDTSLLFPVLRGLWAFYLTRAEYESAYGLGEQFLTLALKRNDSGLLVEAHFLVGFTLQFLGEFVAARAHCEAGIALYDSQQHQSLAFSFGVDPGVNCFSCVPLALWCLGYPDQALQRSREALSLAQEVAHPFSLGWALIAATWVQQYRREDRIVQEQAETALILSKEQGFPFWLAWATILRGWSSMKRGQDEAGVTQLGQGLEFMRTTGGAELARTHFLALLAESYEKVGKREEGLTALTEALLIVDKNKERFYEAELYRLRGELTLAQSGIRSPASEVPNTQHPTPSTQVEAEECFLRAIEIARKQQAKSLELRATMSLARLWQQQGKSTEAHQMLSEIYNWFTEGFDTKDLQEAKALLEEWVEGNV